MNMIQGFIRKIKIFFMNHWLTLSITLGVGVLLGLSIWGLSSMESFYRKMTLAQLPLQLLIGAMHAAIFVSFYLIFFRGGFSQIKQGRVNPENINIKFSDVIGIDEVKEEAMEVVNLIKDHKRVKNIGGKIIKGILFLGPPGVGKTLLAKAIATESNTPFISISGSEFVEVFVGVGASRVRKLFKQARRLAYAHGSCIVFIDELDVIGRGRQFSFFGGGGETNSTQNQLLVEMDGLQLKQENIIVIGATNAAEDILDPALLRPGRFDRKIYIPRPYAEGRTKLFEYYLSKVKFDPAINCEKLGKQTMYKSPADIENIVKEAALIATREGRDIVLHKDISAAMERIELGLKHKRRVNAAEREQTAYHEVGHLITLYFLHPTDEVFKISIASRKNTLGVVHHQPREEILSTNKNQVLANIKTALGGYMAEKLKFGFTTEGVSADFRNAMFMAHNMVWKYGMGNSGYVGDYTAIPESQISDDIKQRLNQDTEQILKTCRQEVEVLLSKEKELIDYFVKELLKKEELEYDEIEAIFQEHGKSRNSKISKDGMKDGKEITFDELIDKDTTLGS